MTEVHVHVYIVLLVPPYFFIVMIILRGWKPSTTTTVKLDTLDQANDSYYLVCDDFDAETSIYTHWGKFDNNLD